ncbi:hypothetical protein PHAVU_L002943 [Phaseolus vulgaris]|uniref:MBD domain-containing protein n=2 Tax=Phaseolus vulgaris TaxID=3885 RepID=V7BWH2_PHAVU|nr:hypothetical protein PHAVU_005G141400g [Phaseolus vulgaris]ESW22289.1 hypothetical protein PHAVU_005G141400g [Phaseolus vulgaris]
MAWKPSQLMLNPVQEQSRELVNIVQRPQQSRKPTLSRELQIGGSSSQFNLPDGWIVEERPRRYNPTHVDRYYYEPHTRRQFRSLSSVQRYLAGEGLPARRRSKPKKANTNLIESGVGKQSSSLRAVDYFLLNENTSASAGLAPKSPMSGEKRLRVNNGKSVCNPSSVAREEKITPMSWKHSIPSGIPSGISSGSVKLDYQKKIKPESSGASVHNLTTPPPAKLSWILSGPSVTWNAVIDGCPMPDSERLRWSETFIQSIGRNGVNGPNN